MIIPDANAPDIKYTFQRIQDNCEILQALMLLEYHNMNYLSGDPATRNKLQRELVQQVEVLIRDIKIQTL